MLLFKHLKEAKKFVDLKEEKIHFPQTETLLLVTKTAVSNPYLVDIFQPSLTFVKEAHFYSDIIPAIEVFENISNVMESERVDAFIRCFGSRISLDSGNILDFI